jgi:actin-related protein 6
MMEQTYIINDIKERCCYVTSSFNQDLETCRQVPPFFLSFACTADLICNSSGNPKKNPIVQEYVLPDFTTSRQGHIRTESDIIPDRDNPIVYMSNERFSVPELLFNPSDIGQSHARSVLVDHPELTRVS